MPRQQSIGSLPSAGWVRRMAGAATANPIARTLPTPRQAAARTSTILAATTLRCTLRVCVRGKSGSGYGA